MADDGPPKLPPAVTAAERDAVAKRFLTTQEMVAEARSRLSDDLWDFLTGGSESETTLQRNRLALDSLALRPRVLRNVAKVDPSCTLLGRKLRIPVFLAPLGGLTIFDPAGAVAVARAGASRDSLVFQSSASLPEMEIAAPPADGRFVFQLYVRGDRDWVGTIVRRAMDVGARALCLTVDSAAYSRRERNLINRFTGGSGQHRVMSNDGREYQSALDWDLVDWIRNRFDLPIIVKGIATGEDAALAVKHGVDIVYASNHGGRQLDHGQGAIETLPEIVSAVGGRAEVIIDGGFVRGTDVLKALALGARAVGIGKLLGWSFAAAGEAGIGRMLDILEDEIVKDMMMLGVTATAQIDKSHVCPAAPTVPPSATSSFANIGPDGALRR